MQASAIDNGTIMQGEYALLDPVGSSGNVFRARGRRDGRLVMVRLWRGQTTISADRVLEKPQVAGRLQHPMLAGIEACGRESDGTWYMVSELVAGTPLLQWADEVGIPPLASVVDFIHRVCQGLTAAHREGLSHDTLHAGNLVVLQQQATVAQRLQGKVLDIGVPAFMAPSPPSLQVAQFLAPEQLASSVREGGSALNADPRMNVYSCGCLLYYLCTGGAPFPSRSLDELVQAHAEGKLVPPSKINPQVSPSLEAVILRALAPQRTERFVNVTELGTALTRVRVAGASSVRAKIDAPGPRKSDPAVPKNAKQTAFDERPTSESRVPAEWMMKPISAPPPSGDSLPPALEDPIYDTERPAAAALHAASSTPAGSFSSAPPSSAKSVPPGVLHAAAANAFSAAPPLRSSSVPPPQRSSSAPLARSSRPAPARGSGSSPARGSGPSSMRGSSASSARGSSPPPARESGPSSTRGSSASPARGSSPPPARAAQPTVPGVFGPALAGRAVSMPPAPRRTSSAPPRASDSLPPRAASSRKAPPIPAVVRPVPPEISEQLFASAVERGSALPVLVAEHDHSSDYLAAPHPDDERYFRRPDPPRVHPVWIGVASVALLGALGFWALRAAPAMHDEAARISGPVPHVVTAPSVPTVARPRFKPRASEHGEVEASGEQQSVREGSALQAATAASSDARTQEQAAAEEHAHSNATRPSRPHHAHSATRRGTAGRRPEGEAEAEAVEEDPSEADPPAPTEASAPAPASKQAEPTHHEPSEPAKAATEPSQSGEQSKASHPPLRAPGAVPEQKPEATPDLPLQAQALVQAVSVRGSLATSVVSRAVERIRPQLSACYARAASAAGHNGFGEVIVEIQLDERGRAHSPQATGGSLPGLAACVAEVANKLATDRPPDTGTVKAGWKVVFAP